MGIDWVIKDWICLGSLNEASDLELLKSHNITHVLTAGHGMPPKFPHEFMYKLIDAEDDPTCIIYTDFEECIEFIQSVRAANGRVFVHCEAGMSRSATICIAFVMFNSKCSFQAAFQLLKDIRPMIAPNEGFTRQLEIFEESAFCLNMDDPKIVDALSGFERCRLHRPTLVNVNVFDDPESEDGKTSTVVDVFIPELVEFIAETAESENVSTSGHEVPPLERTKSMQCEQHPTSPVSSSGSCKNLTRFLDDVDEVATFTPNSPEGMKRLKPRSSSMFHSDGTNEVDESASGTTPIEGANKSAAAVAVTKVLKGLTPTDSDEKELSSWLAAESVDFVHDEDDSFNGVRQVLEMMRMLNFAQNPTDSLQYSLDILAKKLEGYTGVQITSPEFKQMLYSLGGVDKALAMLQAEAKKREMENVKRRDKPKRSSSKKKSGRIRRTNSKRTSTSVVVTASEVAAMKKESEMNKEETSTASKKKPQRLRRRRSATIEMLLLFAKLGLHRSMHETLSGTAYSQLSHMLEGGKKEKDVLDSIDQGSLIELLKYLDFHAKEEGLQRLADICEARLVLMIEKETVSSIEDALLAMPTVVGAIRRVSTYALHFSAAVIGTKLLSKQSDEIRVARSYSTSTYEALPIQQKTVMSSRMSSEEHYNDDLSWKFPSMFKDTGSLFRAGSELFVKMMKLRGSSSGSSGGNGGGGSDELQLSQECVSKMKNRKFRQMTNARYNKKHKPFAAPTTINPTMALQGLLKHVSTVTGPKVATSGEAYIHRLKRLKAQSKRLEKVHPVICVADGEQRSGLSGLPKASKALEERVKNSRFSKNQTPYVFDFKIGVLAFFAPCDQNTALQLPGDTSSEFREILRTIFEMLPENIGGVVALTELTETATLSQHASAGFALSTVLQYLDKSFNQNYTDEHRLGDDCQGIGGTVTAGYLHYGESDKYVFTEESGHYGRRWTQPEAREGFLQFMTRSNLDAEYVFQPFYRPTRAALTSMFDLANSGKVEGSLPAVQHEEELDDEWDFS